MTLKANHVTEVEVCAVNAVSRRTLAPPGKQRRD